MTKKNTPQIIISYACTNCHTLCETNDNASNERITDGLQPLTELGGSLSGD